MSYLTSKKTKCKKETVEEIDDLIEYIKSIEDMPWYATSPITSMLENIKEQVKKI